MQEAACAYPNSWLPSSSWLYLGHTLLVFLVRLQSLVHILPHTMAFTSWQSAKANSTTKPYRLLFNPKPSSPEEKAELQDYHQYTNLERNIKRLHFFHYGDYDEEAWNQCLITLLNSLIKTTLPQGYLAADCYELRISNGSSISKASLGGIGSKTFADTKTQKLAEEMYITSAVNASKNSNDNKGKRDTQLGHYKPDFLVSSVAIDSSTGHRQCAANFARIITLVGELKIVSANHLSSIPDTREALVKKLASENVRQWRCGMARAIVYLESAHDYDGCILGLAMTQTSFARILRRPSSGDKDDKDQPVFLIECKDDFSRKLPTKDPDLKSKDDSPREHPVKNLDLKDFLENKSAANALPHNLASPDGQVDRRALKVLVDYFLAAFTLAERASEFKRQPSGDFQPFTRLDNLHLQKLYTIMTTPEWVNLNGRISEAISRASKKKVRNELTATDEPSNNKGTPPPGGDEKLTRLSNGQPPPQSPPAANPQALKRESGFPDRQTLRTPQPHRLLSLDSLDESAQRMAKKPRHPSAGSHNGTHSSPSFSSFSTYTVTQTITQATEETVSEERRSYRYRSGSVTSRNATPQGNNIEADREEFRRLVADRRTSSPRYMGGESSGQTNSAENPELDDAFYNELPDSAQVVTISPTMMTSLIENIRVKTHQQPSSTW